MKARTLLVPTLVIIAYLGTSVLFFINQYNTTSYLKYFLGGLLNWFLAAVLVWTAYFLGGVVSRVVRGREEVYAELRVIFGFLAYGVLSFILGALGLWYPWLTRAVVGALAIISLLQIVNHLRTGAVVGGGVRFSAAGVLVILVAAPLAATVITCATLPPVDWDDLTYHLYLPETYAAAHGFTYLPRLVYSSMPLGAEMIYGWAFLWGGRGVTTITAFFLNLGLLAVTWRLARKYLTPTASLAAAAFLLLTPGYSFFINTAYVDYILALFILSAFVVYDRGWRSYREAVFAGLFLGGALGVKYTAIHGVVGFAAVLALDVLKRRTAARYALASLAAAALCFIPWAVKAYVERGNPVYPLATGVWGGADTSSETVAAALRALRETGMGRTVRDYLLLPYRLSLGDAAAFGRLHAGLLPFSFIAFGLAVLWFRGWRLLLFGAAAFVSWAFIGSQQLRFAGVCLPVFAISAAAVGQTFMAAWPTRLKLGVAAAGAAAIFIWSVYLNAPRFGHLIAATPHIITGDMESYLLASCPPYPSNDFINRNLPSDAKVLLVCDNQLLYLKRPAVYSSFLEAEETLMAAARSRDVGALAGYVASQDVDYILVNNTAAEGEWRRYPPRARGLWEAYLREYTSEVFQDGGYTLRMINPRG